jgi:hypothetical protein
MPLLVVNDERRSSAQSLDGAPDYKYSYRNGLALKPTSDLHRKLVQQVYQRALESRTAISRRYPSWNKIDQSLTTYVSLSDTETNLRKKDSKRPVSIVVPITYATIDTFLTYMVTAFLDDPIFMYEPEGPEDVVGAMLMEQVVAHQCKKFKAAQALHTMWRDGFAYGIGVVSPQWEVRYGQRYIERTVPDGSVGEQLLGLNGYKTERSLEPAIVCEGNRIRNIDPYMYLPDPNVAAENIQDGEFVGWVSRENKMGLLSLEATNPDMFFNCKYLNHMDGRSSLFAPDKAAREDRFGGKPYLTPSTTNVTDVIWLYVTLVPEEWGLGSGSRPEKWMFALAGDSLIIAAQPMGLDHGMYPVAVFAPDADGYSATPLSRMEVIYPLQETIDWLYSTRMANVRKVINDMIVYDPLLINSNDVENPSPGKLIRTRPAAWGRGVKDSIMQLNVNDVTTSHVMDSDYLTAAAQRASGATDSAQGVLTQSKERVSATQSRNAHVGALSRIEKIATLCGMTTMYDLGMLMASQTKQFQAEEVFFKIVGRNADKLLNHFGGEYGGAKPQDLNIFYDVSAKAGTLPTSHDPNFWLQLLQTVATDQNLIASIDTVKIFMQAARVAGAKNIYDFVRGGGQVQMQVQPQQQVEQGVQSGNYVPLEEASNV